MREGSEATQRQRNVTSRVEEKVINTCLLFFKQYMVVVMHAKQDWDSSNGLVYKPSAR